MEPRFEQFIQERKYLNNVSPRTIDWYGHALPWLPNSNPDASELKDVVLRMRGKGLKVCSVNSYRTAINAYLHWVSCPEGKCSPACRHPRVPKIKDEQRILPTFATADIQKIMRWKPRGFCQTRLHVLVLMLADTGCRIGEAIELRWPDVDFDNLLLKLHGKGAKDRLVPFSFELRRHLWRWKQLCKWDLVFPARNGQRIGRRNELRDVKRLCKRLGIQVPARTLHAFRHTFALNYLRKGGSVFHLQKVLGHSSLEMTRRYANLMTEDLQEVHERVSLISSRL